MKRFLPVYYSFGAVSAAFLFVFYVFLEPPFLSYGNLPFPVLTPFVNAGQAVHIVVERCSTDTKTRVYGVSHRLVGATTTTILPATQASVEPGCNKATSAINVVPVDTPAGRYIVDGTAEVQGTIRAVTVQWQSQPFEVVP